MSYKFKEGNEIQNMKDKQNENSTINGITNKNNFEEELKLQKAFFIQLFENSPKAIIILDNDLRIVDINQKFSEMFDYKIEDIKNTRMNELLCPYDNCNKDCQFCHSVKKGNFEIRKYQKRKDKSNNLIDVDITGYPIINNNEKIGLYVIFEDITRIKRSEDKLKLMAKIFENNIEGVILTDNLGKIVWVNNSFTEIEGYKRSEVIGNSYKILDSFNKYIPQINEIRQSIFEKGVWKGESIGIRKNGEKYIQNLNIFTIKDDKGNITNFVALISDITDNKVKEDKIYNLAYKDSLTNLYNRAFFIEKLNKQLLVSKYKKEKTGLIFIDFDGFKRINDNLGHSTGDKLLEIIAQRISRFVDEKDIVARMGGDEFAIIISSIESVEYIVNVAQKIENSFKEPFIINVNEIYMSSSIGISIYPDDGVDRDSLIGRADIALNRAKKNNENKIQLYSHELDEDIKQQFAIENNLRYALDKNEFFTMYQPIIDVNTEQIIGAEVLIRWKNSELGFITPDKFIPIAESTGLILRIGEWVLKTACEQNRKWQDTGCKPIFVAVNISVKQLEHKNFTNSLLSILQNTGLNPKYLKLEITESVAIKDIKNTMEILKQISDLGIKWSIDDFGTGYSSLGQLNKIAIDTLKIDKTFINDIIQNNNNEIASAIISMAHKLKLSVVAEGVETKKQFEFLKKNKCEMAQGYLFSKPINEKMFGKLIPCEVKR